MKKILFACLLAACVDEQNLGYATGGPPAPPLGDTVRWAVVLEDPGMNAGQAVAVDPDGDVVAAGYVANGNGFITKRAVGDGSERWTVTLAPQQPGSYADAEALAIDRLGEIFVTGAYMGTVDFDGTVLTSTSGTYETFVAEYGAFGTLIWVHGVPSSGLTDGESIALDRDDNIFIVSQLVDGSIQLGSATYTEPDDSAGSFVASFDGSGALRWSAGLLDSSVASSLAIAPNGDVVVVGVLTGSASVGGAVLDPDSTERGFYVRYDNDGLYLSSSTVGVDVNESFATNVVFDGSGAAIVQTTEGTSPHHGDLYSFDDSGDERWSVELDNEGALDPSPRSLAITPAGDAVSSVWADGPIANGSPDATGTMQVSTFREQSMGMETFGQRTLGAASSTIVRANAIGSDGASAYVGTLTGNVQFGSTQLEGDGGRPFIVLVDPKQE
jgi:hypothetical protein